MKAIILNFAAFGGKKDTTKAYYRFDLFDIEEKALYHFFQEQAYTPIPDGVIPSDKDIRETFPRVADVDFVVRQYRTKEGKQAWAPQVRAINAWKPIDLKKLF